MKTILKAATILMAMTMPLAAHANVFLNQGEGLTSCTNISENDNAFKMMERVNWFQGFVSGLNEVYATDNQPSSVGAGLSVYTNEQVYKMLAYLCAEHPEKNLNGVSVTMYNWLRGKNQ